MRSVSARSWPFATATGRPTAFTGTWEQSNVWTLHPEAFMPQCSMPCKRAATMLGDRQSSEPHYSSLSLDCQRAISAILTDAPSSLHAGSFACLCSVLPSGISFNCGGAWQQARSQTKNAE
jgi:hypothetical protein